MGWFVNLVHAIRVVYLRLKNKFALECFLQLQKKYLDAGSVVCTVARVAKILFR
jgi:hypothetical protein